MKKLNTILVFILFVTLALVIGANHEPWVDEAQSWIIARDASCGEIIWDISRYEGTFPLWFLTIKLFISLGLQYEYFFIIPIIISSIGLLVFLKSVDCPKFVKVLLPFSYYVFYQYTIIARSYAYLFLALSLWATFYKERMNKKFAYTLSLAFISMISMHGMIISGILGIIFIIELIKENKIKESIVPISILIICWFIEIVVLIPRADLYMNINVTHTIQTIMISIFRVIFSGTTWYEMLYIGTGIILFIMFFIMHIRIKRNDTVIVMMVLSIFYAFVRLNAHHLGIICLFLMFSIIVNYNDLKAKYKCFEWLFIATLIIYISFTGISCIYDFNENYSGAEQMAIYIKENDIDKEEIYRFGFTQVSLIPYFEKNLFSNTDKTIYEWKVSNEDFYEYINFDENKYKNSYTPKYILVENDNLDKKVVKINDLIKESGYYDLVYQSFGKQVYKCTYSSIEAFNLYKLKNK